jgi:hypothetical protein
MQLSKAQDGLFNIFHKKYNHDIRNLDDGLWRKAQLRGAHRNALVGQTPDHGREKRIRRRYV